MNQIIFSDRSNRSTHISSGYIDAMIFCQKDPFDPVSNPGGYIQLGTVSNTLCHKEFLDYIKNHNHCDQKNLSYRDFSGIEELKARISDFISRRHRIQLNPASIVLGAGATSLIEHLAFHLCNQGDAILLPVPYYQALPADFFLRMGVHMIPLDVDEDFFPVIDNLDCVLSKNKKIKALFLNSPHNPTGVIYSHELIQKASEICCKNGVNLIVDEVYGNCLLEDLNFRSSFGIENNHTHVVSSFSKDFGLCGLGVGYLHSFNKDLIERLHTTSPMSRVSNHTQQLLVNFLSDTGFVESYLDTMNFKLRKSFHFTLDSLIRLGIDFLKPSAGLFVSFNLAKILNIDTFEKEKNIADRLLNESKLNILQGKYLGFKDSGWFRLCFATDPVTLKSGFQRLGQFLQP